MRTVHSARVNAPRIAFVGRHNSGKTTLLLAVLPLLAAPGLRVGYLKHAHARFEIDRPEKDSYRARRTGVVRATAAGRDVWFGWFATMSWRTLFTVTAPPIALEASRTVVTAPRTVPTRFRIFAAFSARPVWADPEMAETLSNNFTTPNGTDLATEPGIT